MPESSVLTVREAAAVLGVSVGSAYKAVNRGEIPSIRIGDRVLVPKAALSRLLGRPAGGNVSEETNDLAEQFGIELANMALRHFGGGSSAYPKCEHFGQQMAIRVRQILEQQRATMCDRCGSVSVRATTPETAPHEEIE